MAQKKPVPLYQHYPGGDLLTHSDLLLSVLSFLDARSLLSSAVTARTARIVRGKSLWRSLMCAVYPTDFRAMRSAASSKDIIDWRAEYEHRAGAVKRFMAVQRSYGSI